VFTIDNCEVCGNDTLVDVLNLGSLPLNECLVPIGGSHTCETYPIEIALCERCFTAHQKFQVPKHDLFQPSYKYRARMTGSVLRGMSNLVDTCEKRYGPLSGKLVLDIGCNDGSLLNFFKDKGCKTVGIDPTDAAKDSKHPTIQAYFDEASADNVLKNFGQPDLITFTNVFAHIEDLKGLLVNLKTLMGKNTKLVIENHYLGAALKTGQFDTFYHEHPRTYSMKAFEFIASDLSMNLTDVEFVSRYGGNIRAFIGTDPATTKKSVDETSFLADFKNMESDIKAWKEDTKDLLLAHVKEHGKLRAKAFPGRAAILINMLGLNENHISAVYEITGSIKVGHYIPGTKIPILPEADLYKKDDLDKPILNLAWHLPTEVRANLEKNGYTGKVIDIKTAAFAETA
jgi:SAM-dependent methyltransferase